MADTQIIPPQHDLDAKWDACLDLTVRRFVYSSSAGAFAGLLFFNFLRYLNLWLRLSQIVNVFYHTIQSFWSPVTRWASIAFGAGVGIGSAYAECSRLFDGPPTKLPLPKVSKTVAQGSE
ncbi:hypothetical protein VIGAN_07186900 [Vigna angularis var. angularis]|uniref:MICOS complex subunit MIC10 n=1 Tax=Vigna angularis var. angularis TaxID=157739 RepID=A0A0S3SJG5_PHAAN|nr:hypothetical protein VIGAN_07186900 [Vigna angularis var. angularis]